MRQRFLVLILLLFAGFALAQNEVEWRREHLPYGTPAVDCADCTLIVREGYALLYSPKYQLPLWVSYRLDRVDIDGPVRRRDDFREDPLIRGEAPELSDYKGSGYDRGHMCPAGDSKKSVEVMSESFYMSNMAPQTATLNRGQWAALEDQVRAWLPAREQLWVITGPVFYDSATTKTIGDGVVVPSHFYKIVLDEKPQRKKTAIAFLLPNSETVPSYKGCMVSVDAVEVMTGMDFFPDLPDAEEEQFEAGYDLADWQTVTTPSGTAVLGASIPPTYRQPSYTAPVYQMPAYAPSIGSDTGERVVYVTKSGSKYHREGCRYLAKSSSPISLSRARALYSPCSVCDP